jgi:5-methylcytosine-specific restriction protein A
MCPCGCGRSLSPVGSRGRPRTYFSPGCSLRVNNYMKLQGYEARVQEPTQLALLNPFAGRRHSAKTRATLSTKASVPKPYLRGERNGMYGRTGALNPRYVDGSSPERQRLYASSEWRKVRRQVLARDERKCQRCGSSDSLHLHHILPWAGNPDLRFDPSNITTLCADCHRTEHRKEVRYQ